MNDVDEGGRVGFGRLVQEPIQLHKRDFPATANTRFLKPSNQLQQKAPEHRCGRRSSCEARYFVAGNDGNVVTVKTHVWVTPARRGEAGLTLARIVLVPRVSLVQILRYSLLPLGKKTLQELVCVAPVSPDETRSWTPIDTNFALSSQYAPSSSLTLWLAI